MKRIIEIVSIIAFFGLGFGGIPALGQDASNSSAISQQGQSNTTIIKQNGAGNIARTLSAGNRNRGQVDQSSLQGADDANFFDGQSIGNDNLVSLEQISSVTGQGANVAVVYQGGDRNSATVSQSIASLVLGEGGNYASVTQYGDDHQANVNQYGTENHVLLAQDGVANRGDIVQNGQGLSAELTQSGSGLEYTITQTGCAVAGGCGTLVVTQTGR